MARFLKISLLGIIGIIAAGLIGLFSYKLIYLTKKIPEQIKINQEDMIQINGTIVPKEPNNLFKRILGKRPYSNMQVKSNQIIKMVKNNKKHIYVKINSGGGVLQAGYNFISKMHAAQNRGVKFTCIIDGIAMSMALIIFSECDERYAVFGSTVMWHSMAVMGNMRINQYKAQKLLKLMLIENERIWANTRIHFFPWYFIEHFEKETHLDVSKVEQDGIGYLRVINNIIIDKNKDKSKAKKQPKKGVK